MLVFVPVGVHYSSDLEHVERVTLEVAREVQKTVEGARKDFEPRIRFNEFGGSSINFRTVLAVEEFFSNYMITHEFVKRLHKRYDEEGIVIPFHMRTLHIPDSPQIKVQLQSRDAKLFEPDSE
jgi:small-conductance mechanosensitive channel